jgi:hypothetical protein
MSFHESVRYPHGLVDAKKHKKKSNEQLNPQVITNLFDKQLAIRRLKIRELESAGEKEKTQSANLYRIVKFKGAREKLKLVIIVVELGGCW